MHFLRTPHALKLLAGLAAAGALLLVACGGDNDNDTTGPTSVDGTTSASSTLATDRSPTAAPTATPLPFKVCDLITAEEVTAALGGAGTGAATPGVNDGAGCTWTAGENRLAVSVRKGVDAQKDYDAARTQAAPVNGFAAEGSTEQLQAFRAEGGGQSKWFVQRGDTFVTLELANASDLGRAITARSLASKLMARVTI